MQPERWKEIESIFQKVLEHDEVHRAAVIEDSCAGDESLRREVESLLAHHRNAKDLMETPHSNPARTSQTFVTKRPSRFRPECGWTTAKSRN